MLRVIFVLLLLADKSNASDWRLKRTSIAELTQKASLLSVKGNQIEVLRLNNSPKSKITHRFYIQAGLHGNEVITTDFALWLAQRLISDQGSLVKLPAGIQIDIVPKASPDTFNKSRYNSNGVNLNRNFDVLWGVSQEPTGDTSFSEPESLAINDLFQQQNYDSSIDVHGYINWVVLPSPPKTVKESGLKVGNIHTQAYDNWVRAAKNNLTKLPKEAKYKLKFAGELGDGGAFEDWSFWRQQTLSLCLELMNFPNKQDYEAYENFIYQTFISAIRIKKDLGFPAKTNNSKIAAFSSEPATFEDKNLATQKPQKILRN